MRALCSCCAMRIAIRRVRWDQTVIGVLYALSCTIFSFILKRTHKCSSAKPIMLVWLIFSTLLVSRPTSNLMTASDPPGAHAHAVLILMRKSHASSAHH